jgi:hypothetical protein
VGGHMRTMASRNIKGKGWYSAPGNSDFLQRRVRFLAAFDNVAAAAESMTGMSTINTH